MKPCVLITAALLGTTFLVAGCENRGSTAVAPASATAGSQDARSGSGGAKLVADVTVVDHVFAEGDATPLASTCPGPAGQTWGVDFAHSLCLIVEPVWMSSREPYALTDDVKLITLQEKSSKLITHVRLLAQDVIGEAGVQHNTDWIPVVPVVPSRNGGTLHVHAANVDVWRLSGHTGGQRVEVIGRISIGDLVYR